MANPKSWLGKIALLGIGLGSVGFSYAQSVVPADIAGGYDCASPGGVTKQKLILFPGGRWSKGSIFDPGAFKMRWVSFKTRSYESRTFVIERDPKLHGVFRAEREGVFLYTLEPGIKEFGVQRYFEQPVPDAVLVLAQRFRMDRASRDLIEVLPANTARAPLTCTRGGFF
jgi:hypothetical protein